MGIVYITEYFKRFLIGDLSRKVPFSNMLNTPLASTQFCCLISLCKTLRSVIRFSALTIFGPSPRTNDGFVKDNVILFISVARRPSSLQSAAVSAFLFRLVGLLEPYSASITCSSAIDSGSILLEIPPQLYCKSQGTKGRSAQVFLKPQH